MTKDGLPGEASQEGQSRPVSLAGLVLVLCVALMGVMGVSITLPILPKLGAVFHQDAAGVALLITCFTLPSAFMTPVAGVLADRFGRKAVLLPGLLLFIFGIPVHGVRARCARRHRSHAGRGTGCPRRSRRRGYPS